MKTIRLKKEVVAVFSDPVLAAVRGGDASGAVSCECKTVRCSVSPCYNQSETVLISNVYTECCAINYTDSCGSYAQGICDISNPTTVGDDCSFKP